MGPGPIYKFLTSVSSLAKKGNLTIDDAYRFAQQEFGQVSDILKLQINKIFKQVDAPKITLPKKDEVFDTTVTKLPYDESGRPFNPRDPLKKYGDDPEDFATGGRVGFAVGSLPKGIQALIKTINKKFGKGAMKTADEIDQPPKTEQQIISEFEARNPSPSRQLTDDEIADLAEEVGELDAYDFDGTVGSANRIRKEAKDYQDEMYQQYKMGKLDPEAGDKSPARKKFLEQKLEEMLLSDDPKLMTKDEIEELTFFDMGTEIDQMRKSKPKSIIPEDELTQVKKDFDTEILGKEIEEGVDDVMRDTSPAGLERSLEVDDLMLKYPGINRDLAKQIANDPDPKRKADVISMIEQTFKMDEMGMSGDEIIDTFRKKTDRTKQANGGLSYLMGM